MSLKGPIIFFLLVSFGMLLYFITIETSTLKTPGQSFKRFSDTSNSLSKCAKNILDAGDAMIGKDSPSCPMLVPPAEQICLLNSKLKKTEPPPKNATTFCAKTYRKFSFLRNVALKKEDDNMAGCKLGEAIVEIFCDTHLDIRFLHRNYTSHGYSKKTLKFETFYPPEQLLFQ